MAQNEEILSPWAFAVAPWEISGVKVNETLSACYLGL